VQTYVDTFPRQIYVTSPVRQQCSLQSEVVYV